MAFSLTRGSGMSAVALAVVEGSVAATVSPCFWWASCLIDRGRIACRVTLAGRTLAMRLSIIIMTGFVVCPLPGAAGGQH